MTARYAKIPAKGVYLPNSPCFGFNSYMVHAGDVIKYRESSGPDTYHYRLARVLDFVTHEHGDNGGKEFRKATGRGKQTKRAPKLRVLAFNDMLTHVYERWVDVEDVTECRAPSAEHARFAAWLLGGPLPKVETVLAASSYGTLADHYFGNACEHGNLPEDWRARTDAHHARVAADNEAKREATREAMNAKQSITDMVPCPACGKPTRITTAGCDHCALDDK